MMRLYNTFTRKKEEFQPLKKTVGLYSCGPTVYHYAHVGNLRTYIFVDVLKRAFQHDGFKVKHIMNITDVGHLTSDADAGEDKMEKGAAREGTSVWDIAKKYTQAFKDDLKELNIEPPGVWAKATDHIKEQITLVKTLEKKGYTYETPRAIYFDTSKVKDYGKLARLNLAAQRTGAGEREAAVVEVDSDKKHPADFVLWFKRVGKYTDHTMHWPSPWGEGFPGWHIECSAMSMKYLGETFDIHTGGIDHVGVHHTNEIAQSEAATGKPFVRFWLHGEFLILKDGEKMAKSGKNFITLATLREKGFDPLSFRYLALTAHYRSPLAFSWEALKGAQNGLHNLYAAIARLHEVGSLVSFREKESGYKKRFNAALNDDLNTSECLGILWVVLRDETLPAAAKKRLIKSWDEVLGLGLLEAAAAAAQVPKKIRALIARREELRAQKQFGEADTLRSEIAASGYSLEDTPEGPFVFRKAADVKE